MPASDYNPEIIRVLDTNLFGREVIKLSLLHRGQVTRLSLAEFEANHPRAYELLDIPASIKAEMKAHTIVLVQGDENNHIINLPPVHKLTPMLTALSLKPDDLDKNFPDIPGTTMIYPYPQYIVHLKDGGEYGDENAFFNRVGDYAVAGCR